MKFNERTFFLGSRDSIGESVLPEILHQFSHISVGKLEWEWLDRRNDCFFVGLPIRVPVVWRGIRLCRGDGIEATDKKARLNKPTTTSF